MGRKRAIALKRAYEPASPGDGCRILVERLWPRGLSKSEARIDLWCKEAAPSAELRRWFGHDPDKWPEFRRRYRAELRSRETELDPIRERLRAGPVTFVFAARETRFFSSIPLGSEHRSSSYCTSYFFIGHDFSWPAGARCGSTFSGTNEVGHAAMGSSGGSVRGDL